VEEWTKNIKKPKLDTDATEVMKRKVKKQTKKLTRTELENILSVKMVEMITNNSEIAKLQKKCDSYDEIIEVWKNRAEALHNQVVELSTAIRQNIQDPKNIDNPMKKVRPKLIPRSVGLQVRSNIQLKRGVDGGGGQIKRGPELSLGSLSSPSKPTNIGVIASPQIVPKVEMKRIVRISPLSVKSNSDMVRPTILTRPNCNVGRSSITLTSPTTGAMSPVQQDLVTAQSSTPLAQSSTSQTVKPTINVVEIDLSDDEEKTEPAPQQQRPVNTLQRAVGIGQPDVECGGQGGPQLAPSFFTKHNKLVLLEPQQKNGVPLHPQQQNSFQQNTTFLQSRQQNTIQQNQLTMMWPPRLAVPCPTTHPSPLPCLPKLQPLSPDGKTPPPRPTLKISRDANGIILWWNMSIDLASNATITSYRLYAYQESNQERPGSNIWKKIGDLKALPLPMACTLTHFTRGNKVHFAVRAVDVHQRVGHFSEASSIFLN